TPQTLIKLLKECLKMDPNSRCTIQQVNNFEYFRENNFHAEFSHELRRMIRKHRSKNPHLRRYSNSNFSRKSTGESNNPQVCYSKKPKNQIGMPKKK
ncbi:MAG: Cyclin-dependent kinase-like 2, partial [Paramarteilia canceri]